MSRLLKPCLWIFYHLLMTWVLLSSYRWLTTWRMLLCIPKDILRAETLRVIHCTSSFDTLLLGVIRVVWDLIVVWSVGCTNLDVLISHCLCALSAFFEPLRIIAFLQSCLSLLGCQDWSACRSWSFLLAHDNKLLVNLLTQLWINLLTTRSSILIDNLRLLRLILKGISNTNSLHYGAILIGLHRLEFIRTIVTSV